MSGIAGWVGAAVDEPRELLTRMAERFLPLDTTQAVLSTARSGGIIVHGTAKTTSLVESDGLRLALLGHPRWDSGSIRTGAFPEVCRLFLAAYRDHGPLALESLQGDFALALLDVERGEAFLAIDRIGIRTLTYQVASRALLFASTLDALGCHPLARRDLDPQSIYDYVYFHVVPGPRTVFREQFRVPPGHFVLFEGERATVKPYWRMAYKESGDNSVDRLKHPFLEALREATMLAADQGRCGAFLSGGTDSSTIVGMLGRITGGRPRAYSIGFAVEGYDELGYARIAARHFSADHHEYYVTPTDVVDAIPKIAAAYDQPFGNASAVPTYYCARLAKENGVERLLGGDGGDELFGGNARYSKQYLLSLYSHLPRALRTRVIEPMAMHPRADVPGLRRVKSYIEQASPPMPARYESYNIVQHVGAARLFAPDFLASVDTRRPQALLDETFRNVAARSLINQMLGIDLKLTLADNDLPKVTRMCELAGVDVAFPMLEESVVSFSAMVPPGLKLRRTELRYFFKEALKGFLPAKILRKQKHGFGLPVGPWLLNHQPLRDLARSSLDEVAQRGIVQSPFLNYLCDDALRQHPAYYGSLVWVLMMLGRWLQKLQR